MIQNNLPKWDEFQKMVEGIWEREYYTNHGPLVVDLENKISKLLGVKHAICMTNSSIALMIAIKALNVKRKVIIPSFSHINIAQSVKWAGIEFQFCKVNNDSFSIDTEEILTEINEEIELIIAINNYGITNDIEELEKLANQKKIKLLFVSDSFFGEKFKGRKFGNFGDLEIFSFHESQMINGANGACVCTADDELAARLRNIRSSYGAGKQVPIPYTGNGRMSEIQAGLTLLSLDHFEENRNELLSKKQEFNKLIKKVKGVSIYNSTSFCSNFILVLDYGKLGIDLKDFKLKIKSINKHIELFDFFGVEIDPPYIRKDFLNNNLINNSIGLPSSITLKQFNKIISLLTKNVI
ncbi:aminotransferase class I/II-fold pyridoxal phosphate-dependent enzyme [Flaviramulus sp. BrNp1-15]|uniref:aminotransferase class I/II-fold pyridoxal phosphate-dependent enzyme n=1 Tax=Flaviramulus sp. BrNp1-15 TaxID=2916754 RepID=UPI001EE89724|nr:aminotransferase class I/II-fold pyridoxal phosphate-dependent enzyme [Flaviramulus sp. BrNp1-15]ULC60559.1 aminotransferase class I/II-fold pyridoxal phosphate-dependent enzyme [Flaviramulus sp. BrNp1-15]